MSKSEVYSWRLTPELKAELEAAARAEKVSVADLLAQAVRAWLGKKTPIETDEAKQARINAALDEVFRQVEQQRSDGPPSPSATNENIRKGYRGHLLTKQKARGSPPRAD